ncbi:uncharacterized protein L3040_005413 [Drepanopeziza brunnea f. sp. 'multigermtubi']|uniref:uncharacterized protein n=1 Tax=Drepanopeziza brunnea f. sp. 'multigermtubi' TaxID=698441 RepID=UPI002386BB0A|nr:hypothetical protein L3040_005413 [Drepanopeziza brunnea f. sp. 'multigermtubi']
MWSKVSLDVSRVPTTDKGMTCFVLAKEDLSGWPEGRPLRSANAESIAKFLWEDIVCRHGLFGRLIIDGGPENKAVAKAFATRDILDGLSKVTNGGFKDWVRKFSGMLFAVRTSIHAPTGVTPFFLNYGREAELPLESRWPVWRLLPWQEVRSRADLLAMRFRQLELRDEDIDEIILRKKRHRLAAKATWERVKVLKSEPIKEKDLVLLYDVKRSIDMSADTKLDYRWLGPYVVSKAYDKGYYKLQETDGTELKGTFAANRLKRFYRRDQTLFPLEDDEEEEEEDSDSSDNSDLSEYEPSDDGKGEPLNPRVTLGPRSTNFQIIPLTLSKEQKLAYKIVS